MSDRLVLRGKLASTTEFVCSRLVYSFNCLDTAAPHISYQTNAWHKQPSEQLAEYEVIPTEGVSLLITGRCCLATSMTS